MEPLDPVQIRVLGCLLEKQQTTPDAYPLTLNSLRLACNQSTSRDPVVDYDEAKVRDAAQRLGQHGWARLASYHGSRSTKYRQLFDEALGLSSDERAVLCVLMLRGPQTLGELKQRSEKLHAFADLRAVEETLDRLSARELGRWLERRPGQKEARYTHLLGGDGEPAAAGAPDASAVAPGAAPVAPPVASSAPPVPDASPHNDLAGEVARLRSEVDALREEVSELRERLAT